MSVQRSKCDIQHEEKTHTLKYHYAVLQQNYFFHIQIHMHSLALSSSGIELVNPHHSVTVVLISSIKHQYGWRGAPVHCSRLQFWIWEGRYRMQKCFQTFWADAEFWGCSFSWGPEILQGRLNRLFQPTVPTYCFPDSKQFQTLVPSLDIWRSSTSNSDREPRDIICSVHTPVKQKTTYKCRLQMQVNKEFLFNMTTIHHVSVQHLG